MIRIVFKFQVVCSCSFQISSFTLLTDSFDNLSYTHSSRSVSAQLCFPQEFFLSPLWAICGDCFSYQTMETSGQFLLWTVSLRCPVHHGRKFWVWALIIENKLKF
ncbi:hypothetical protein RvY_02067 [Ramazzottius varieornatus]|uniref:Uncharacterized protein n=1 Tax=Ramazzottius varieornatus TaxID=947166 RepID=A0A1D1UIG0_RAMVA|nr:hypothetical protein RvY_02067 [Ramazzottius varieornatus]